MSRSKSAFCLVLPILLGTLFAASTRSQITSINNGNATPVQGSGHDYIQMLGETVNPANGSVSLRVHVQVPPGRQFTLPFAFGYDSNGTFMPQGDGTGHASLVAQQQFLNKFGWSYLMPWQSSVGIEQDDAFGNLSCVLTTGYAFQDSDGGRYSFNGLVGFASAPHECTGDVSRTFDTSGPYSANLAGGPVGPCGQSVAVSDLKGTTYSFPAPGCTDSGGDPIVTLPTLIEDRNGNKITIANPATAAFSVTDTLGRAVLSSSGFGTNGNTITAFGLSPYHLTWANGPTFHFTPGVTFEGGLSCSATFSATNGPLSEITAITLPNGKQYSFTYDATYGLVSKITYPTGGYISYSWGVSSRSDYASVSGTHGPQSCNYRYDTPALAHRSVSFDGTTIALTQDFTYITTWSISDPTVWVSKQTTVTTHDNIRGISYQTVYNYTPISLPQGSPFLPNHVAAQLPLEQSVVHKDTTGTIIRTVSKTWLDQYRMASQQTALETGQTSQIAFSWNGSLISEKDEYDYGQSTPTRKTSFTYGGGFDRPCKTIVSDGSGNRVAETDSFFDGVTTLCSFGTPLVTTAVSGVTGHDETNYGPASTLMRGNLTSTVRQCFQGVSSCPEGNTSVPYTYDETGQVLTSTDARGNMTHYSYVDAYTTLFGGINVNYTPTGNTNAFLTQITDPLTHTQNFTYDFNNGQLTSAKDPNNLVTSYIYNDSLARPTSATSPDGGQTTIAYNDTTQTVTTSKKINASQTATTVAIHDGLGHVKQTQLTSDPQGIIFTDTTDDGLGEVRTISNPYRTGSDPTTSLGTTTYFYDVLGRKCLEVPPDGTLPTGNACPATQPANTVFTAYSGNTTTVTDQTGKSRRSFADGLGRLTQVFEDPAGLNYETDYTYDVIGNLITVSQKGGSATSTNWRTRTFTYDSLSRLLTSTNPESGAITYVYDAASNLISKTDARGITTNYNPADGPIDVLNRVTKITYSNGDPSVTFAYDQAGCLGLAACQNIGHRTSMTDAAGSESWAYQVDQTNSRSVHKEQRTTSGITKTATYFFDLAGNIAQAVYPTGRTVNYTYDNANRPSTAADASNGITYATDFQTPLIGCLAGKACYTPQGTYYTLSIGQSSTFSGLNLKHTYNSRLQPNELSALSTAGNAIDITYSFIDPVTAHNAGHVYGITNNLDTTRSQTFTYDALNRITGALTTSTHATSSAHCWGETYNIDPWANLQSIAATTNSNYTGCSQESGFTKTADANNHLSGFSYDASGNTANDGVSAYTWDAKSQMKTGAGTTYTYDGNGRRVQKSSGKVYWYGSEGEILAETDASGNTQNEYVFFGGQRIAMLPASGGALYYVVDLYLTSRVIINASGAVCYDADFYPFGGERAYTTTCSQNYKFTGKERDLESGLDSSGMDYYSPFQGRPLSPNGPRPATSRLIPQTLNSYGVSSNASAPVNRPAEVIAQSAAARNLSPIRTKVWPGFPSNFDDASPLSGTLGGFASPPTNDKQKTLDADQIRLYSDQIEGMYSEPNFSNPGDQAVMEAFALYQLMTRGKLPTGRLFVGGTKGTPKKTPDSILAQMGDTIPEAPKPTPPPPQQPDPTGPIGTPNGCFPDCPPDPDPIIQAKVGGPNGDRGGQTDVSLVLRIRDNSPARAELLHLFSPPFRHPGLRFP